MAISTGKIFVTLISVMIICIIYSTLILTETLTSLTSYKSIRLAANVTRFTNNELSHPSDVVQMGIFPPLSLNQLHLVHYHHEISKAREFLCQLNTTSQFEDQCLGSKKARVVVKQLDEKFLLDNLLHVIPGARTITLKRTIDTPEHYHYPPVSSNCYFLNNKSIGGPVPGFECGNHVNVSITKSEYQEEVLTYISIIPHAVVNSNGEVISGGVKVIPKACGYNQVNAKCSAANSEQMFYGEVFTITQYWGHGYFHGTLEDLPRLAPYIEFLHHNPDIKIHVAGRHPLFPFFGIPASLLISGTIRAHIVYMPEGTRCGSVHYLTGNILAQQLQQNLGQQVRDTVVIIRRSHKRWFDHHRAILEMLRTHGDRLGLRVFEFGDQPVPPINVTRDVFHRALVIVAPHGAGEANMAFSQPGTALIEGLCYAGGKINRCYQHAAQIFGLRYYGLVFDKSCRQITPQDVEQPFLQYMKLFGYI